MRAKITLSLAALALGVALAAAPALAQSATGGAGTHQNALRSGSAWSNAKIEQQQRGYTGGPLYNYVAPQPAAGQFCPSARKMNDNGSFDEPRCQ